MSELRIYPAQNGQTAAEVISRHATIAARLAGIGVLFERWKAGAKLHPEASQDEVIEVYREPIDRLMREYGFASVDVVGMHPNHPSKDELREKFLHEHTHSDFEVRFFVDGGGLFYIHHGEEVFVVHCVRGDLISVPANTPHWFDMGDAPSFKAIRLFTTTDGWVAKYTGDEIATRFPKMDEFLADKAA
jgi:1,2-dihydroxy-3-keto-5-methylthiopentene dioxygenase